MFVFIFFIIGIAYYIVYVKHEKSIEKNDEAFKNFLLENDDSKTLKKIENSIFSVNKALLLINRFYETNEPKYLAYAIQNYVISSLFIVIILGAIFLLIVSFLIYYNIISN